MSLPVQPMESFIEFQSNVLELLQENDTSVISAQLSSDELVSNEDILNTHIIIDEGREELEEIGDLRDHDGKEVVTTTERIVTLDFFGILRRGAINLVLPFINGIMLGFGEILAHEIGFKYGFVGARVYPPRRQAQARVQAKSAYI